MVTNFIHWIDHQSQMIAGKVSLNSNDMINSINNFLALFMMIGILILGYMILMGYGREALQRFMGFFIKFVVVSSILASFSTYNNTIGASARQIPIALVDLVNCKTSVDPSCTNESKFSRQALMGKNSILDKQFSAFFVLSKTAWSKANILDNNIGMWVLSFSLIFFSTLFIIGTGFILTAVFLIGKVLILFGPIFIASMLFKISHNFFIKWFELMVKLIIIEVFTVITAIFINGQLEALLLSFNNKLNFSTMASITDYQLLYSQITLANVTMICSVFFLGLLLLRLIIPVAHELSQGVKFAGEALVKSSSQFISSSPNGPVNYTSNTNSQSNASFSSLFKNTAANQYKQNYQQNIANTQIAANSAARGSGGMSTNQYTNSTQITSTQSQNSMNNSAVGQYKMAYQSRFRGA